MNSYALSPAQDAEVTFISGVAPNGTLAAQTFWTWNDNTPATYGSTDYEAKYGARVAGAGAPISYSFDAGSNWTATEQGAFKSAMALWSAEANVTFQQVTSGGDFTITRGSDGHAEAGTTRLYPGAIGGAQLGEPIEASLSIDTSVGGFGPIGEAFNGYGGYPWMTMEHELGHILGLGHAGAYDEGQTSDTPAYTADDSRAFSLMSYIDPDASTYGWTITSINGAREEGSPVTPMMLDILAIERIYGLPASTPLSDGQVFGFNCNISGDIEPFFDFAKNTQPIVTLWDEGTNNTLDVSGFGQGAVIDLHGGAFSSVGGLQNNLAIAFGTQIDTAVGGAGADRITANDDGDMLMGAAGGDTLIGGAGHDTLFGGADNDVLTGSAAATLFGGKGDDRLTGDGYLSGDQGNDTLSSGGNAIALGGDGNDVLTAGGHAQMFGNMGDDTLSAGDGANASLFGGQDQDVITVTNSAGGYAFGNLGDDHITTSGLESVYGGQGNDTLVVTGGVGEYLSGDLGSDTITGGGGDDTIVGGGATDVLAGGAGANRFVYGALSDSSGSAHDVIIDFNASKDHLDISAIDAQRAAAGQAAFHWVASFDGGAGEAELVYDSAHDTTALALDADGDRAADFVVVLNGNVSQGGWLMV